MSRDEALVQACIRQERVAQRQLYELFASKLFAAALRYTKNRADAEDVLQDSFIKIYEKIKDFRFESPLEAWLRRIVVNTALKHLRNQPNWSLHIDNNEVEKSFELMKTANEIRRVLDGINGIKR